MCRLYFHSSLTSASLAKNKTITPIDRYVIEFVRDLRIKRELGQEDIAGMLGAKRTFISNVESRKHRAKYNLTHINALAFYLDMSPQDFLPKTAIDPVSDKKE
jgi:transcriptional regulator with XRE-family HTH domain